MWLRLAAVGDVAYVGGADQALHREHAGSLSVNEGSGALLDLRARADAYDRLFANVGDRLTGAPGLHDRARVRARPGRPAVRGGGRRPAGVAGAVPGARGRGLAGVVGLALDRAGLRRAGRGRADGTGRARRRRPPDRPPRADRADVPALGDVRPVTAPGDLEGDHR